MLKQINDQRLDRDVFSAKPEYKASPRENMDLRIVVFVLPGILAQTAQGGLGTSGVQFNNACQQRQGTCKQNKAVMGLASKRKRFNIHWTSDDVKHVCDCSHWTVELVNKLSSASSAHGFTASCLARFNISGVERKYLEHISPAEIKQLEEKTILELLQGPTENIPLEEEWISAIMDKVNWEENGHEVAQKFVQRKELMELVMEGFADDPKKISRLFDSKTISKMPDEACKLITKELIEACCENAFRKITPGCLRNIPDDAFGGFTVAQFHKLNPKALEAMTFSQADELQNEILASLNKTMASHWGTSSTVPKLVSKKESDYKAQRAVVKEFIASHPCMALKGLKKQKIKSVPARKIIDTRCEPIWHNTSSGTRAVASSLSLLVASAALLF